MCYTVSNKEQSNRISGDKEMITMNYETKLAFLENTKTVLTKAKYPNINWMGRIIKDGEDVAVFRTGMKAYADDFDLSADSKPIRVANYILKHYGGHIDIDRIDLRNEDIHFVYQVRDNKEVELLTIYQEYYNI